MIDLNDLWSLHPAPHSKFNVARRRKIYQLTNEELLAFSLELHETIECLALNGRMDNDVVSNVHAHLKSIQKVVNKAMSNRKRRVKKK